MISTSQQSRQASFPKRRRSLSTDVNAGRTTFRTCSKTLRRFSFTTIACFLSLMFTTASLAENALQIRANMVVDTPEALLEVVDRAQAKGATSIQYSDTKITRFGLGLSPGDRWEERTRTFFDGVKARGMDIILNTIAVGYCGSMLAPDANLATGYPILNQPLRVEGNQLVPVSTASISNGGFERANGNEPEGWSFQDAAGERTFVDTVVKRSGNSSFRADARGGAMSRVITEFAVKPFHQYTLKFWVKTQDLVADQLLVIIRDNDNRARNLTNQLLSTDKNGQRAYFNNVNGETMEWTQMKIAFNSLEATNVNLGLSMFGGRSGSLWWDDVSISDTPTLNWLVRDDLPQSVANEVGQALGFGTDVAPIVDTELGQSGFPGNFDTYHTPPAISLGNSTKLSDGDIVNLNGYHTVVTASGQVGCSWNNEQVLTNMKQVHETLEREFAPTGYRLNYDEIRTGGYEPTDIALGTSGDAMAASIERAYADLFSVAPNAKHLFWSDMVDPFHNARENYYQVNNTLDGAWTTLDPSRVTLITWWEGEKITANGRDSLEFFANLGFEQVLGAFYDADVQDNYERWQAASSGVSGILGGLYASWVTPDDYSQIETFGDLWWQGEGSSSTDSDAISAFVPPSTVSVGRSYNIDVPYDASQNREIVLALQNKDQQWKILGTDTVTVAAGAGTATLEITLREGALEGENYAFTAYIKPVDGNWESRLDRETVKGVTVTLGEE